MTNISKGTAIVLLLALACCGSGGNSSWTENVIYVPYFDRCEEESSQLETTLQRLGIEHKLSILIPSVSFMPRFGVNSLIELEYNSEKSGPVGRIVNQYLSSCGPNAAIDIPVTEISDSIIRRAIDSAPGSKTKYGDAYYLSLDGNTLRIFYSKESRTVAPVGESSTQE